MKAKGQNAVRSVSDIAEYIGKDERTTQRLIKLNELIEPLQQLVSTKN